MRLLDFERDGEPHGPFTQAILVPSHDPDAWQQLPHDTPST